MSSVNLSASLVPAAASMRERGYAVPRVLGFSEEFSLGRRVLTVVFVILVTSAQLAMSYALFVVSDASKEARRNSIVEVSLASVALCVASLCLLWSVVKVHTYAPSLCAGGALSSAEKRWMNAVPVLITGALLVSNLGLGIDGLTQPGVFLELEQRLGLGYASTMTFVVFSTLLTALSSTVFVVPVLTGVWVWAFSYRKSFQAIQKDVELDALDPSAIVMRLAKLESNLDLSMTVMHPFCVFVALPAAIDWLFTWLIITTQSHLLSASLLLSLALDACWLCLLFGPVIALTSTRAELRKRVAFQYPTEHRMLVFCDRLDPIRMMGLEVTRQTAFQLVAGLFFFSLWALLTNSSG